MRNLNQRTLGELAAMRDSLFLMKREIKRTNVVTTQHILRLIELLESVVNDEPFGRNRAEEEQLTYRR